MLKPYLIPLFVGFAFLIFIYSLLFNEEVIATNIYAMVSSPYIIDNDLVLDISYTDIEDFHKNITETADEIYEPGSMDLAKDVIVLATSKVQKEPETFSIIEHTVSEGESLWSIARNYNISLNSILNFNKNIRSNVIHPNTNIKIPNMDGVLVKVRPNESLYTISQRYKVSVDNIIKVNNIQNPNVIRSGQEIFVPGSNFDAPNAAEVIHRQRRSRNFLELPVQVGYVSSPYGNRNHPILNRWIFHEGIDIAAQHGTRIYAAADGRVTFSGWIRGYGRVVVIQHSRGFETRYAHLDSARVRVNEWVEQGQYIARMGRTGRVTGTHLHFEVRRYGEPLNPNQFINFSRLRSR